jgi:hypothetical protein
MVSKRVRYGTAHQLCGAKLLMIIVRRDRTLDYLLIPSISLASHRPMAVGTGPFFVCIDGFATASSTGTCRALISLRSCIICSPRLLSEPGLAPVRLLFTSCQFHFANLFPRPCSSRALWKKKNSLPEDVFSRSNYKAASLASCYC